jgi:hypothetical protein
LELDHIDRIINAGHGDRIVAALDRIAAAEEAQALPGGETSAVLDSTCQLLIDGTNTTKVFKTWYPRAMAMAGDAADRYEILSRFAKIIADAWGDKTYTLRSYTAESSGDPVMTPLDDLADKTAGQICTEASVEKPDWVDEDPMTWYIRANALSKQDGTMNILAIEGVDGDFDITGESAPVYTFAVALWIREWTDGSYDYISFKTVKVGGFYPFAGDTGLDNKKRALTWHPTFPGGKDSKGRLGSGAGQTPMLFTSAQSALPLARKVTAYEGLWNDCDTIWALRMWQLRHFNLENSGIAEGCTSYSLQYKVAAAETGVRRVLVTEEQGKNFIVGSTASVGDPAANENKDRYNAYMRNIADLVKVESIERVSVSGNTYMAINLDTASTFDVTETTYISTMPWHSGSTEALPGHKDGCRYNLTGGGPLRVAGVEMLDGAYTLGLDPLYNVTAGSESGKFNYQVLEQRDSEALSGSISGYKDTGISFTDMPQGWNYVKAFARSKLGVLFPRAIGGSSTTYYKSAFFGAYSTGVRSPWRFCSLANGGSAGLAGERGSDAPSGSNWYGRPRLCGSGKKRGEWSE